MVRIQKERRKEGRKKEEKKEGGKEEKKERNNGRRMKREKGHMGCATHSHCLMSAEDKANTGLPGS